MKSIFLLCSVLGAVSYASECQADEHSLLQARRLVRTVKTMGSKDSIAMLKNMRDVAESLLDGSDTTLSPDEVNEALDAAGELLAELSPVIRQQIENAQQQIDDAASAVQVCHAQSVAELRSSLRESTGQRAAAVESCHNTLDQLRTAETQQCNIAEDCLCDEARVRTTDQEPLCASITETYEVAFCEHHHVCTIFHQCHSQEAEVYQHLRADVEAEMALTVQEYIAVEQSRCLTGLIMEAMTPPRTPISHAALIACDDVDVSALNINFPDLPSEPAACPVHTHGDPQCEAAWTTLVLDAYSTCTDTGGNNLLLIEGATEASCKADCVSHGSCGAVFYITQASSHWLNACWLYESCDANTLRIPGNSGSTYVRTSIATTTTTAASTTTQ